MALSHNQLQDLQDSHRWLTQRSPQANQRVASWLRSLAPELDERRAAVAERMAGDFEALAHQAKASPSAQR
jgi:phosphohistidine phosphatase SixA